jgi:protein-S-isoprenylcysteine O-methyltransferase Ste14
VEPAPNAKQGSLAWATIGTILFVVFVPGTVIGYIPYRLCGWTAGPPLLGWTWVRWAGPLLFLGGLPIFIDFLVRFVRDGRGTPAPVAPPRYLVVTGTFRYVRNPGYIGVLSLIVGQGLLFASRTVLEYAALVALMFHLFVVLYEEPSLRRQFGADYAAYCRRVHRWLPRLSLPR